MKRYLIIAALIAVGCHDNSGGTTHDMAMNGGGGDDMSGPPGPDMTPPLDMVDTTAIPNPMTMHVGMTGNTCCLVTAGATATAYLLNPTAGTPGSGALRVVTKAGVDKAVDTGVTIGGFAITPDGKAVIYTKPAGTMFWADVSGATVTPKSLFGGASVQSPTLASAGFMSPSGHYFLVGVKTTLAASTDLHVVDMKTGNDVYQRLNGGFDYIQLVLPDDTLFFQDTAGGTGTGSPPVQTLYWTPLPPPTPTTANSINTRTASLTPTADNKTLTYMKTNGDLYTWDVTAHTGAGSKIASNVVKYALGGAANGPVAYIGTDGSIHVQATDGTKLLDTAASKATSFNAPIVLAPDNGDVYFYQNGDVVNGGVQNNAGTLMRVAVMANATPSKVADLVSIIDLQVMDNALLFLRNIGIPGMPPKGQFGDAAKANRDGTNITALGLKVPVGGLRAVNPGPNTWFAMHLANSVDDGGTNTPINGSPPVTGKLMWADYMGGSELQIDAIGHQGAFEFSDDGRDVVFVGAAAWSATPMNYAGALKFLATRAPMTNINGNLAGVTELGPVSSRALFVNAPGATPAGVYYVTY